MKRSSRELFGHLAVAVAGYERECRIDHRPLPAELLVLREFFADCATLRLGAPLAPDSSGSGQGGAMTAPTLLLSKRDLAVELRCSARTVDRLLASGAVRAVKVEGATRVRRVDLEAYVAGLGQLARFRDSDVGERSA